MPASSSFIRARVATHARAAAVLAALTLVLAASVSPSFAARLARDVVPTAEEVRLALDPRDSTYTGEVRIGLRVERPVGAFALHARELEITRIVLAPVSAVPRGSDMIPVTSSAGEEGLLTLTTSGPLAPGDYSLAIEFRNDFDRKANSLYRLQVDGEWYSFTDFEPDGARESFPCFDEPSFKIPWQVMVRAPAAHLVVTNTPVERDTLLAGGMRETIFRRTPPLSSYLVAIATGPLDTVDIPGLSVPGRVVTVKGRTAQASEAVRTTPPLLAAVEAWFGSPYPFEKLDLIAVPEFWAGAMENPGAITYRESILLHDPATMSAEEGRRLVIDTAHELAHMWFGDLVTMEWWDDLWLNESFAEWMGNRIAGQVFPAYRIGISTARSADRIMRMDAHPSSQAIRHPVERSEELMQNLGLAYYKGQAVIDMVEQWIGAEAFQRAVRNHIAAHEWGNARAADLFHCFDVESGRDVTAVLSGFLDQPGVPLVRLESAEGGAFVLSSERFMTAGASVPGSTPGDTAGATSTDASVAPSWEIPVQLKYRLGGEVKTRAVLLTGGRTVVRLDAEERPDWVLPAAGGVGYYRWQVPRDMLIALTGEASRDLTPRERIAILGNVSAELDAGVVDAPDVLETLRRFGADPDPQVVSAVIGELGRVEGSLVPDSLREAFARYVRVTLRPALDRFGLARTPDEAEAVSLLRPDLIEIMADEGQDEVTLVWAEVKARAYLADPRSVDPDLAPVVVRLAAIRGDRALFDEYRRRFEAASAPDEREIFLHALGAFRDPAIAREAYAYSLAGPIRPPEMFAIPMTLASVSEAAADRGFEWVKDNFEAIAVRLPRPTVAGLARAASGCSEARLAAAREFFADESRAVPGTQMALTRVADQVHDCASLRKRAGAQAASYFRGLKEKQTAAASTGKVGGT